MAVYEFCGLRVRCDWDLPRVPRSDQNDADVAIEVRSSDQDPVGAFTGEIPGVLRFGLDATRVEIAIEPSAPRQAVTAMVLGPVMSLVLRHRGRLPLHAAGLVAEEGHAWLFGGPSGVGKSTLVAMLLGDGHRFLGDDLIAVDTESTPPVAFSSYPETRLWPDIAARVSGFGEASPVGETAKTAFSMTERFHHAPAPIAGIFTIAHGPDLMVDRCGLGDAAFELFGCTWERQLIMADPHNARRHFTQVVDLASHIPVWRIVRPAGLNHVDAVCRAVVAAQRSVTT